MLAKILKDSLEQMSKKDLEELCHELGMTNINKMIGENRQVLGASVLTLFKTGGFSFLSVGYSCCKCNGKKNSRAWFNGRSR